MRITYSLLVGGAAVLFTSLITYAQKPKAGLYEVTNRMTWQRSPFPEGTQPAPGSVGPHTAQACITQAQIDRYNGPKPEAHGECQVSNIQKHRNGMTAELACNGRMKGKGTVRSVWTDSRHSKSKVHFTGEMQVGQNTKDVEWTLESESVYKGPNCGEVKPAGSSQ
jgi:hypothetical protein